MKILVVNAGSSSLKYQLIDMKDESVVAKGACERIAIEGSKLEHKAGDKAVTIEQYLPDHTAALELVLKALTDKEHGAVKSVDEIGAVGHRILHSAEDFKGTVLVTDETVAICEKNMPLGPLHMPANIACVKACREILSLCRAGACNNMDCSRGSRTPLVVRMTLKPCTSASCRKRSRRGWQSGSPIR